MFQHVTRVLDESDLIILGSPFSILQSFCSDAYCAGIRSKAERRNKKKRAAVAEQCSENDIAVCCPGTIWYEEEGKCLGMS